MTRSERRLLACVVLLACIIVSRGVNSLRGDASHYLAASHSLLDDRDLDLRNQYEEPGTIRFDRQEPTDLVGPGPRGGLYLRPAALGFAILLAPVSAAAAAVVAPVDDGLLERVRWDRPRATRDLVSLAMAVLCGWTAVLVVRLTNDLRGPSSGGTTAAAWAFLTPPVLSMSFGVFPDILAAMIAVWFARSMIRNHRPPIQTALALGCLPWLGTRYLVMAVAGTVWLAARSSVDPSRRVERVARVIIPIASIACMLIATWWTFGRFVPPGADSPVGSSSARGLVGLLFDRNVGLLILAPFWGLAIAGWRSLANRCPSYVLFATVVFAGLWITAGLDRNWWGGESPPGRPLVAALPLLVPLLAEGLAGLVAGWGSVFRTMSMAWAVVMAAAFIAEPARMWSGSPKVIGLLSESVVGLDERSERRAPAPDPGRRLLAAIDRGGSTAVARLVAAGGPVDHVSPSGRTPLIAAVQRGDPQMVETLIRAGAEINAADRAGWTPLLIAVRRGEIGIVRRLIDAGADVNASSRLGWSPVMWAAYLGSTTLVRELIAAGAHVQFTSRSGRSALVRAAEAGHLEVVWLLLAAGASPRAAVGGHDAAFWAAINGHAVVAAELEAAP